MMPKNFAHVASQFLILFHISNLDFMHEYSLAQAVINAIAEFCEKNKIKHLVEATVVLGELQQIDKGIFRDALNEIKKECGLRAKIKIKDEGASFRCRACNFEWNFSKGKNNLNANDAERIHFLPDVAHCYMRCPRCHSPDFEIVKGRGIYIDSIAVIHKKVSSKKR